MLPWATYGVVSCLDWKNYPRRPLCPLSLRTGGFQTVDLHIGALDNASITPTIAQSPSWGTETQATTSTRVENLIGWMPWQWVPRALLRGDISHVWGEPKAGKGSKEGLRETIAGIRKEVGLWGLRKQGLSHCVQSRKDGLLRCWSLEQEVEVSAFAKQVHLQSPEISEEILLFHG